MPRNPEVESAGLDEHGLPPVIHTDTLCHLTGITARRLHQLITDKRIPASCNISGDRWMTTLTLCEVFGYYRRRSDQQRPAGERELEIQTTIEDLRAKRLKNAKMARELLPYRVMAHDVGEIISGVKSRFLSFPEKMAQRTFRAKDKVEAAEILEKEIRDILGAFSDPKFLEDIAAKLHDDEFDESGDGAAVASGDTGAGSGSDLEPADAQ